MLNQLLYLNTNLGHGPLPVSGDKDIGLGHLILSNNGSLILT